MKYSRLLLGSYNCLFKVNTNFASDGKYEVTRHCNAEYELFIILSGSCRMDVEDEEYFLSLGDALLVAPKRFHAVTSVSSDFVNFVLPFSVEKGDTGASVNDAIPTGRIFLSPDVLSLCHEIRIETRQKKRFLEAALNAKYSLILTELFRAVTDKDEESAALRDTYRERLDIIDDFFEKYATTDKGVPHLARLVHLSERQLTRTLIKHYGMNFSEKKLRARMDRAAWLLRTTDYSISKICEEVGYISENSFFKAFKKSHGITPAAYRKEYRQWNLRK